MSDLGIEANRKTAVFGHGFASCDQNPLYVSARKPAADGMQ